MFNRAVLAALAATTLATSAAGEAVATDAGVRLHRQLRQSEEPRPRDGITAEECSAQLEDLATDKPELSVLATAAGLAGFGGAELAASDPVTIFAPSNAAFEAIAGPDAIAALGADPKLLTAIIAGHIAPGLLMGDDIKDMELTTLAGTELSINLTPDGDIDIEFASGAGDTSATVTMTDIRVCGSVLHVINSVLLTFEQVESLGQAMPMMPDERMPDEREPTMRDDRMPEEGTYGGDEMDGGYGSYGRDSMMGRPWSVETDERPRRRAGPSAGAEDTDEDDVDAGVADLEDGDSSSAAVPVAFGAAAAVAAVAGVAGVLVRRRRATA